mmetsp:Transcript_46623/g.117426  ORF Transcript_46623/g.117426 Transcript_46623/m.117426 type:complete len:210 (+) Transcript_46623:1422-2051(+)
MCVAQAARVALSWHATRARVHGHIGEWPRPCPYAHSTSTSTPPPVPCMVTNKRTPFCIPSSTTVCGIFWGGWECRPRQKLLNGTTCHSAPFVVRCRQCACRGAAAVGGKDLPTPQCQKSCGARGDLPFTRPWHQFSWPYVCSAPFWKGLSFSNVQERTSAGTECCRLTSRAFISTSVSGSHKSSLRKHSEIISSSFPMRSGVFCTITWG